MPTVAAEPEPVRQVEAGGRQRGRVRRPAVVGLGGIGADDRHRQRLGENCAGAAGGRRQRIVTGQRADAGAEIDRRQRSADSSRVDVRAVISAGGLRDREAVAADQAVYLKKFVGAPALAVVVSSWKALVGSPMIDAASTILARNRAAHAGGGDVGRRSRWSACPRWR